MSKYCYLSGPVCADGFWGSNAASLRESIAAARAEDPAAPVTVVINSEGGDVYEGVAIYNLLRAAHVDIVVSGMAASIASVIAMAGDHVAMYSNSVLYVHHAWTCGAGNASELQQQVEQLRDADRVLIDAYMAKSGRTEQEITALLDGPNGDGSEITADRALTLGLIDEVLDPATAVAACLKSFRDHTTQNHITRAGAQPGTNQVEDLSSKETHMADPVTTTDPVLQDPAAECGAPKKAEETVEKEIEIEKKKEETPEVDPREERITELEKKVEELTAKIAAMADQAASQAQYRSVVAAAHQTREAKADEPKSWPEALKKLGFVEACAQYPALRTAYIDEINAKSR